MTAYRFRFHSAMRRLCEDVTVRVEEFGHIDMAAVAVTFAQARRRVRYGLQAKLTPMRFEDGALSHCRVQPSWTVQRLFQGDREMLYILTFYLPRFLDQTFREKMITVFHELYHISPDFDGDIRRMDGRYHVHSHSQKEYDRQMEVFVVDSPPPPVEFISAHRRRTLQLLWGGEGVQIPIPQAGAYCG